MRKNFKSQEKIQRLLWCDRHCCLCDKPCGIHIEFAHIGDPEDYDIDNAIPVCYDCHAHIGMYNVKHPRGSKYKSEELKKRREQIYDKYTRQYVAPIQYVISNQRNPYNPGSSQRAYPKATFNVTNLSDYLPITLKISLRGKLNGKYVDLGISGSLYTGGKHWNVNPGRQINGWFEIKSRRLRNLKPSDHFEVRVLTKLIDAVGREHALLEDGYVYNHKESPPYWYFEP